MRHITCSLKPSFAHENCLIFAGIGSGLHCYQFFIFTYAYALIFIHRCFGSLFWLLGVLIRSLLGPFPKGWGSLLVLEAVDTIFDTNFNKAFDITQDHESWYDLNLNPTFRQDSELQSVSSHNDTTDDNQSSFTESSSHYSNTYR